MKNFLEIILGIIVPASLLIFSGWFCYTFLNNTIGPIFFVIVSFIIPVILAFLLVKKKKLIFVGIAIAQMAESIAILYTNYYM